MAIWPYGENGITNSLLEAFDTDHDFFSHCIRRLTKWIDGNDREFARDEWEPEFIIQQPGFGRRGFGEPDGLIKAGRYVFYVEAKAVSYSSSFGQDWGNFAKLSKYFAIADGIKNMELGQQVIGNNAIHMNDEGELILVQRRFQIGERAPAVIDLYNRLRNVEFYIIIMTRDKAENWPEIREHYNNEIHKISELIQYEENFEHRFGWMPLIDIFSYNRNANNINYKLDMAFRCNGFE